MRALIGGDQPSRRSPNALRANASRLHAVGRRYGTISMLLSFEYLLSISQKPRETLLETVQVPMQLLDLLRIPFRMILEHFAHQLLPVRVPLAALILRSEKSARPVRRIALQAFAIHRIVRTGEP